MDNLEIIEAAHGGPFVVRATAPGYPPTTHVIVDPVDMDFMSVLQTLQVEHVPLPVGLRCSEWKRALLFSAWAAHYDLPDFTSAQRLAYLLDRYRSAIVYDIQTFCGADIGALWRSRRWRTALDLIDHLPAHSWYSAAVANDEEHAAMIAESLAARQSEGEKASASPDLHTWTPEVAAITSVTDAIRQLIYTTRAVQGDKQAKPPEPLPRPSTPLEAAIKRANFSARQERHEALVKRLLPHKRRD